MTPLWIICFVLCANVNPKNKCNDFRLTKPQGLYMVLHASTCMEIGKVDCITVTGHISTTLKLRKDYMYIMPNSEIFPEHKRGAPLTGTSWTGWLSTGSNGWTSIPNYAGFSILKSHVWSMASSKNVKRTQPKHSVMCKSQYLQFCLITLHKYFSLKYRHYGLPLAVIQVRSKDF